MDVDSSGSSDSQEEEDSSSEDSVESDDDCSIGSRGKQNLHDAGINDDVSDPAALNELIINEENNPEPEGNFNINNEALNDHLNIEDDIYFGDAINENPQTRYLWENLILFPPSNSTVKDTMDFLDAVGVTKDECT